MIAPHPRRETAEVGEGSVGTGIVRETQHVAIHAVRVGPVGLHCDGSEASLLDETTRDACPLPVELVGSVGCLPDEDEPAVADEIEERVIVVSVSGHRMSCGRESLDGRLGRHRAVHAPVVLAITDS